MAPMAPMVPIVIPPPRAVPRARRRVRVPGGDRGDTLTKPFRRCDSQEELLAAPNGGLGRQVWGAQGGKCRMNSRGGAAAPKKVAFVGAEGDPAGKSLLGRKISRDFKSAVALLKVILLKD